MTKLLINNLRLSDEELDAVADLAGCNYSPEKIALYLEVSKEAFLQEWFNAESLVREAYDRGQLLSVFNVNKKQKELAESGNITAAQVFLKEAEKVQVDNVRNQCFFNE